MKSQKPQKPLKLLALEMDERENLLDEDSRLELLQLRDEYNNEIERWKVHLEDNRDRN